MIESVEDFGIRWRDRALEAELEIARLRADSQAENERLRQVIAHLMTNPLNQREATYWTSDIDGQTATVEILDGVDNVGVPVTTVRVADPTTEK
ncbi:hypothetical protein AB0900_31145 [Streptomyces cellulosae]